MEQTVIKSNTKEIPPEELVRLLKMIEAGSWRTSVKYPEFMKHDYIMLKDQHTLMRAIEKAIKDYGYEDDWGQFHNRYVWIGEYKYWGYDILLNREHVSRYAIRQEMEKVASEKKRLADIEDFRLAHQQPSLF